MNEERYRTEEALRQSLDDVTRMHQVSTRLLQAGDVTLLLHDILDAAIEITGADMGNIQLLDGDRLRIAAQRGFDAPFLEFFDAVHVGLAACGAALQRGERVVVADVANSAIFMGTQALEAMIAAGARAVQSTPLVSRSGRVLGMFSTHYRRAPQQPGERALHLLDILARQAADLIEQRLAEERLRSREAELELVINQTPFMLTRCGRDLRYRFVSRAYAEMLRREPADIAGKAIVEIMGEDGFETIRPYVETVLQGTRVEFECDIPFKESQVHSLRVVYTPDTDGRGHVQGWIASILDIGERKQAEEARVRADEERTRLLARERAARAQAEDANRGKDQFLATVSHELRTPLSAILGWAAMLEETAPPDTRTAKGLQSISRNTRTLTQLVDDLLDVSRMISGKMRLDFVPMDVGDVIDAAVEAVLPAAGAKDIGIHAAIDPAARAMTGDPIRLQQAVWNLLSNAVKFTPAGGRVDLGARVLQGDIEIAVTDSGIGIDAAFLPYVFDRFRQADNSSTRGHSGLGLGLAIVRHIVELHGGSVRAESQGRDAGTRLVIQLPRSQPSVGDR